jgi:acetolactate synthase-1/2/3 large subunit
MVARADAVLFVGSHCGSQVTDGWRLPSAGKAKIVQLDIDPEELGRNYPNDVSLLGDARTVLEQVKRELATRANGADEQPRANAAWLEDCRSTSARWRRRAAKRWHDDSVPMRPERLCQALSSALPDDAVLVVDTGHAGIWAASMIDMRPPQSFLRSAGSLGWALPAAIGAKCGAMERPVVGFTGDGGFYYHLAELETAKRLGLPVVIVVNDNRSFSQDFEVFNNAYDGSQTSQGRSMWWFEDVDLAQVAASFGWEAERIERPGGLDAALSKAITAGRPVLLDVVTDPMALAEPPFGGRSYYATGGSGDS